VILRGLVAAAIAASAVSCATLPPQIAKADGRVLVEGSKSSSVHVNIRTVDGGDVLWVRGYRIGNQAWLTPGPHKIGVMCEFFYNWGTKILPGNDVEIDVAQGNTYQLDGAMSSDGEDCEVTMRASR